MGFLHSVIRCGCGAGAGGHWIELRWAVSLAGVIKGQRVRDLRLLAKRVEHMMARGCEDMKTC